MGAGAPRVTIVEYDLTGEVPSFIGVNGALIGDWARGVPNDPEISTNVEQFQANTGKPNPKKFGLTSYSGTNFLRGNSFLTHIRVDKGQTYATWLVRSIINPQVQYDSYGYLLPKAIIDPIVYPLGPLTKDEIAGYQFPQYPTTRIVASFTPKVHLVDVPSNGDVVFAVDVESGIKVGDKLSFMDTTGMSRDDTIAFQIYSVANVERSLVNTDYVQLDRDVVVFPYNSAVKHIEYFDGSSPVMHVGKNANIGDSLFYTKDRPVGVVSDDIIRFTHIDGQTHTIGTITPTTLGDSYNTPITGTATEGAVTIVVDNAIQFAINDAILFQGQQNVVSAISIGGSNITVSTPISSNWTRTVIAANNAGTHQISNVGVTVIADTTVYTVTIDGTAYTYTSGVGATTNSILVGLKAQIDADLSAHVTTSIVGSSLQLTGVSYVTIVITGTANLSVATPTAAVAKVAKHVELIPTVHNLNSYGVKIGANSYSYDSDATATAAEIVNGLVLAMAADPAVDVVNTSGKLEITAKVAGVDFTDTEFKVGEVQLAVVYDAITISPNLTASILATQGIYKTVTSVANYNPQVLAKNILSGSPDTIRVNDNDYVAEGDTIQIGSEVYTVLSKFISQNYSNLITVNEEYVNQTSPVVGVEIYKVEVSDFEFHDAMLVWARSPGADGNNLALSVADSPDYQNAFIFQVYYNGVAIDTEKWEVTQDEELDGYQKQLQADLKINNQSAWIRCKTNLDMVDYLTGKFIEPLKTTQYVRQPVHTPIYNKVGTLHETVFDGDNYIRVSPLDIANIDITKPIMVGTGIYGIASFAPSQVAGPIDTVVLTSLIVLGLDSLPPSERHLNIGDDVKQYFDRDRVIQVTVNDVAVATYTLTINGTNSGFPYQKAYSYTALISDTAPVILEALRVLIHDDATARVHASLVGSTLTVSSNVAGVDFTNTVSSKLTYVVNQTNTRSYTDYPVQNIQNTILPTVIIGSQVTLLGSDYIILDAAANLASGGDDKGFPTIGQFLNACEVLANDQKVDFLVVMDGGVTSQPYQSQLDQICRDRRCFAFLSVGFDAQANPDLQKVVQFRQNMAINSSFSAVYSPWVKTYDKDNDFYIFTSPESWPARDVGVLANTREIFYAIAGWDQGQVQATDVYRRYTLGEQGLLYDNQINPIIFDKNLGISINGQKTLQVRPGPTTRINVRMALIVIGIGLKAYLEFKKFKFNDAPSRKQIATDLDVFMAGMKSRGAVDDYQIRVNDKNNPPVIVEQNRLIAAILIKPKYVAEFIEGQLVLTPSGLAFSEVVVA